MELFYTFEDKDRVNSIAFSPDSLTLASGSDDKCINLYNMKTYTLTHTFEHKDWICSVAFSPDGLTLALGSTMLLTYIELLHFIKNKS